MKPEMMTKDTEQEEYSDGNGIDSIISKVEEYIANPKMVTPETLTELKEDLIDLKEFLDGDSSEEPMEDDEENKPSLTISIGKKLRGE